MRRYLKLGVNGVPRSLISTGRNLDDDPRFLGMHQIEDEQTRKQVERSPAAWRWKDGQLRPRPRARLSTDVTGYRPPRYATVTCICDDSEQEFNVVIGDDIQVCRNGDTIRFDSEIPGVWVVRIQDPRVYYEARAGGALTIRCNMPEVGADG